MKVSSIPVKKQSIYKIPVNPGVYKFIDKQGKILYIGKAKNLRSRLRSYFGPKLESKTRKMLSSAKNIDIQIVESEFEALLLEARLVKLHKPKYNIQLRDDKSPLYIVITKEKYPRILALRQTQLLTTETKYVYGPFLNVAAVKQVLRLSRKMVPFATHKPGKRGCLYSQIKLCNPCPSIIENQKDKDEQKQLRNMYLQNIRLIKAILEGRLNSVQRNLEKQMKQYSNENKFEQAQKIKEQLQAIGYVVNANSRTEQYLKNPNLIEDIRASELHQLQKIIGQYVHIDKLKRLECYDVAHLQGTQPTASMVTFINGEADKTFYRHFKIKKQKSNDDYASMQEVLYRRSKHFKDWGKPDLIIVDGGKGQVAVALEILGQTLPVVGIAKRFETLIIKNKDEFVQIKLNKGPALNLIQRIRNESHRFARRYHHKLISKNLILS